MSDDFSGHLSLFDLFRQEAENQCARLTEGLLALEREPDPARLEALMRAAHSMKGAARIVGLNAAVRVGHAMEDCFVAVQNGAVRIDADAVDTLLKATDLIRQIAFTPEAEMGTWETQRSAILDETLQSIRKILETRPSPPHEKPETLSPLPAAREEPADTAPQARSITREAAPNENDRVLRVGAPSLNRLLGLASEVLVESRWLGPFRDAILRLNRQQRKLLEPLEALRETLTTPGTPEHARFNEAIQLAATCAQALADRRAELELFNRSTTDRAHRLYDEALEIRMRPFADGVRGFPRRVRDLARSLGKEVRLEIGGASTPVDRDLLERLEAPLAHLLHNAVDHGMEMPSERESLGKPREGIIRLEACHVAGQLQILVEDDGRGLDPEEIRAAVVEKGLGTAEMAAKLSHGELMEFLFLPGFSLRKAVSDISGRGVGLDAVQTMVRSVGGSIRTATAFGRGLRFQIFLPLTLSVVRALLIEVAGEPYAIPLVRIRKALQIPRTEISALEGKEYVTFSGQQISLVAAARVLGKNVPPPSDTLPVAILGDQRGYGLAVDRFLGERQLVVQPLDPRLGKVKTISAGALMPDNSPVLILDVDDLLRSIEALAAGAGVGSLRKAERQAGPHRPKRILVVDDSLTVRELERKLLLDAGYEVEAAVDGMDGWNAVRTGDYDLVVTDVDMPRIDGIELVRLIRNDARVKSVPVMIVSYKDRPEDRHRGLEAGADYYLTKGSFHDETLLHAVTDLIGKALDEED